MLISAREDLRKRKREEDLSKILKSNQNNLVNMNTPEFIDYVVGVKKLAGQSAEQIINWFEAIFERNGIIVTSWLAYRDWIKNGSALVPIGMDIVAFSAIASEMKRSGKVFDTYKVRTYSGKNYIIFKGYPGLRRHLTGRVYLANSPKLISFGIGKRGALKSIKTGFVVSILISVAFHTIDQILDDTKLWHDFVGGVAVDLAIAAASSGIAWGFVAAAAGTVAVVAVGPIVAVIIVSSVIAAGIYALVDTQGITDRLAASLRVAESNFKADIQRAKKAKREVQNFYEEQPDKFIHNLFGLEYFEDDYR